MDQEITMASVESDALRWRRVKSIFLDALDRAESEREKYLDEICGGDAALKKEVGFLLAAHVASESFIESPAFKVTSIFNSDGGDAQAGKLFGNYRIIREIGVGGMGAVFLAERADGEFTQKTALKIVRQNFADRELINRFKRERQILASLNHAYIAKLLDGGVSSDGIPFLVMEYVDGEPITDFAVKHNLNVEERLQLFVKICAAVAEAHRNLIIHRDLKPANIFVTGDGEPKLLDFGLAKLIDDGFSADEAQTLTAFRAMTPAYASPEQLRGEAITTSSDIYSLGVVLYELLTGDRPFHFRNQNLNEMINVVCNSEPARPSEAVTQIISDRSTGKKVRETGEPDDRQTNKISAVPFSRFSISPARLKGDLDNIILTAMQKEPARRYGTVEKFAEDIERHLQGLPVRARPNTFAYRAEKFIKRNYWTAAAGLLILLTLLGGIVATVWQARRADEQRARAERRFQDVRRLANSFLFEISPKIENLPGATDARETLVKRGLEYLDSLAEESADDRDLQRELAAAYEKVGDVQGKPNQPNLGDLKGALVSYQKAGNLREALVSGNSQNPDLRHELANNYEQTGYLLWWSDETAKAVEYYDKALVRRRQLVAEYPESADYRKGLAGLLMTYGDVPAWNKETAKALEKFNEAMAILQKLTAENPSDTQLQATLARCFFRIGNAENYAGDYENALKNLAQSEAVFQTLVARNPNDYYFQRGLWQTKFRQCENFLFKPDKQKALETCPQLIDLANNLASKDAKDKLMRHDLASSYYYTAEAFLNSEKYAEAIPYYEKANSINSQLAADFPDNSEYKRSIATIDLGISESQLGFGQLSQAQENAQKARELLEQIIDEDPENKMPQLDLATVFKQFGEISLKKADRAEAKENFNRALELLQKLDTQNALTADEKKLIPQIQEKLAKIE